MRGFARYTETYESCNVASYDIQYNNYIFALR